MESSEALPETSVDAQGEKVAEADLTMNPSNTENSLFSGPCSVKKKT